MERDYKTEAHAHWDFINQMAKRRFWQSAIAEKAALAVMDGFAQNDWAALKIYRGEASFGAFVRAMAVVELENFAGARFGRRRPPLWVRQLGGIWEKLHALLCRQRVPLGEATEFVCAAMEGANAVEVERAARRILARIADCGMVVEEVPLDKAPEVAVTAPSSPSGESERSERDETMTTVFQLLLGGGPEAADKLHGALRTVNINISSQERLFLKMCYQDGLAVTKAGQLLGMGRWQAAARMRRILDRLRREFERAGLYQEMMLLLQDGG
ncbi:MAG: hypothetical protein LBH14_01245 [Desulfobulbaceae bacterium]|jgi:DNA-directed RNA polymerase specialized sigma24 family protein|nr:hypothetical protein [Desulfobulbaceae bacterium]